MIGRLDQTWTTQSDAAGTGTLVLEMDWNVYGPPSIADPVARRFKLAEHDRLLFDDASAANCADAANADGTACAGEVQTGLARRVAVEQGYGYDGYGNSTSVTDNDGQTTISVYDDTYQTYLAKTTNALAQTEWRTYDDFGSQTGAIDRNGQHSTTQYDGLGRKVAEWFPGFARTGVNRTVPQRSYAYVSFGDPNAQYVSQIDRSSSTVEHEVRHLFDGMGIEYQMLDFSDINGEQPIAIDRLEEFAPSVANPQAQRRVVVRSEAHFRGDQTQWLQVEHDQADRPVSVRRMNSDRSADAPLILPGGFTLPARPIVRLAYQGTSHLSSINSTDGNGHSTLRSFDARGRLVSQIDAAGNVTGYGYDGLGRPTRVAPTDMDPIAVRYDLWGRKRSVSDPQTGTTRYTYFDYGPVATTTNAVGDQISFTYDSLHRVAVEDDRSQAGIPSRFVYTYDVPTLGNGTGRLTAVTECALNVACTAMNPSPDGARPAGTSSFSYDSLGNLSAKSVTIAGLSGKYTRSYAYDWMSRVVQKSFPDNASTTQQNTYLNDGTPTEVRLIGGPHGDSGERIARFYGHNAHHQVGTKELWSRGTNAAILTNYQYNNFHWLATLVSTQAWFPGGAQLQSLTYVYDNVGNVTSIDDEVALPSQSEGGTFMYDTLNRLSSATGSYGRMKYTYDAVGNFKQRGPLTYQYSACGNNNAYRCIDGVTSGPNATPFRVVHDPAGRRVLQSAIGDWTYQYDARGQLVSASLDGATVATMTYNFAGRRVRKTFTPTSSRPTTPFLISVPLRPQTSWLPVAFALTTTTYYIDDDFEIRVSDSSQTPQEVVKHIQLPGIGRLATINTGSIPGQPSASDVVGAQSAVPLVGSTVSGTADGTWLYLPNHIGTSLVVVDATGQQVNQLVYEPYGTLLRDRSRGFDTVTHKFTAQEEDEESGLVYYRSRYYDPVSARFITPDSIVPGGGLNAQALNRFAYVLGNPIRYRDVAGHAGGDDEPSMDDGGTSGGNMPSTNDGADAGSSAAVGASGSEGAQGETTFLGYAAVTAGSAAGNAALWTANRLVYETHLLFETLGLRQLNEWLDEKDPDHAARNTLWVLGAEYALAQGTAAAIGEAEAALYSQQTALENAATRLVVEGHQLSRGYATITAGVVEDAQGTKSILGVVTGNDRVAGSWVSQGYRIALDLELRAEELGFEANFYSGEHIPDYHSEGLQQFYRNELGVTPVSPTFTNNVACSAQCAAAQREIDANILEITRDH